MIRLTNYWNVFGLNLRFNFLGLNLKQSLDINENFSAKRDAKKLDLTLNFCNLSVNSIFQEEMEKLRRINGIKFQTPHLICILNRH